MIFYVATERFSGPIARFLRNTKHDLARTIRLLTYEELFAERAGPIGHYIFTDMDRLSRYELDSAALFAEELRKQAPDARILNHPARVLERTALLVALHRAGLNSFTATRLDTGERPPRFPVFIRAEDGHNGPETGLIDENEFDGIIADLRARGVPLRGRIAIGFAAEKGKDGQFRKYGAFNVDGAVIPQHLIPSGDWSVKRVVSNKAVRTAIGESADHVEEEREYLRANPHRHEISRAFALASIEYGRMDYGVVGGRLQVYEINTNPEFPRFDFQDHRSEMRNMLRGQFIKAFRAIDLPLASKGTVRHIETRPRAHNLHLPRLRLPVSLARQLGRAISERANLSFPSRKRS